MRIDMTAVGYSSKKHVKRFRATGALGLACTVVGIALTAASYVEQFCGTQWFVCDKGSDWQKENWNNRQERWDSYQEYEKEQKK